MRDNGFGKAVSKAEISVRVEMPARTAKYWAVAQDWTDAACSAALSRQWLCPPHSGADAFRYFKAPSSQAFR
jgi:hypothetical protein